MAAMTDPMKSLTGAVTTTEWNSASRTFHRCCQPEMTLTTINNSRTDACYNCTTVLRKKLRDLEAIHCQVTLRDYVRARSRFGRKSRGGLETVDR